MGRTMLCTLGLTLALVGVSGCIEDDRSELEDQEIEELNRIVSARVLFTKCKVE